VEQQRPPIVWVFVAYNVIVPIVWYLILGLPTFDSAVSWVVLIASFALGGLVLYWFVRGVRPIWWLFVLGFALAAIPTGQSAGRYWLGVVVSLIGLVMLLAPSMRRYFFPRSAPDDITVAPT
jgi:hypothetical protein